MDGKRKVPQVFNNNPQGRRLPGQPKNSWCNCVEVGTINAKLQIGERGQNQSYLS
jgi:hypothetical protein